MLSMILHGTALSHHQPAYSSRRRIPRQCTLSDMAEVVLHHMPSTPEYLPIPRPRFPNVLPSSEPPRSNIGTLSPSGGVGNEQPCIGLSTLESPSDVRIVSTVTCKIRLGLRWAVASARSIAVTGDPRRY